MHLGSDYLSYSELRSTYGLEYRISDHISLKRKISASRFTLRNNEQDVISFNSCVLAKAVVKFNALGSTLTTREQHLRLSGDKSKEHMYTARSLAQGFSNQLFLLIEFPKSL